MSQEADDFWHNLDETLLEEEQALEDFRAYLDALTIEDAETAVHGLLSYLHELEHPVVEDLVMGWERGLLNDSNSDNPNDMPD